MPEYALPSGHMKAAVDYLSALRKLGLTPEAVLWAYDEVFEDYVLILLTDHFDKAGPTEIYRLLTRAYNAAATPKKISPFSIRLHSPKQNIAQIIRDASASMLSVQKRGGPYDSSGKQNLFLKFNELWIRWDWVVHYKATKRTPVERAQEWRRFSERVERLAA
jgi:hypothetical protein